LPKPHDKDSYSKRDKEKDGDPRKSAFFDNAHTFAAI
jgi:hypothetical protein